MPELDPGAVVRILNRHGVRYAIIGGIAAQLSDLTQVNRQRVANRLRVRAAYLFDRPELASSIGR